MEDEDGIAKSRRQGSNRSEEAREASEEIVKPIATVMGGIRRRHEGENRSSIRSINHDDNPRRLHGRGTLAMVDQGRTRSPQGG
jgi:hypothetical protein